MIVGIVWVLKSAVFATMHAIWVLELTRVGVMGVVWMLMLVVGIGSIWVPAESSKTMLCINLSLWACTDMQRPIPCPSILSASSLSRYPTVFPSLNACTKSCMRF